jgi:hypothetical protein
MPLSKVNNVSFDITFWGRLLNYGRLTIDSAATRRFVINDVPSVEHINARSTGSTRRTTSVGRDLRGTGILPDDGT